MITIIKGVSDLHDLFERANVEDAFSKLTGVSPVDHGTVVGPYCLEAMWGSGPELRSEIEKMYRKGKKGTWKWN